MAKESLSLGGRRAVEGFSVKGEGVECHRGIHRGHELSAPNTRLPLQRDGMDGAGSPSKQREHLEAILIESFDTEG